MEVIDWHPKSLRPQALYKMKAELETDSDLSSENNEVKNTGLIMTLNRPST